MAGKIRTYGGAVALITGGASGIGRAFGEELARRGAEVILADIDGDGAAKVAAAITSSGGRAKAARLDVRDRVAALALVDETISHAGRLDYVFNNAGTGTFGEVHLYEEKDWDVILDVNVKGLANVVHAAYPRMVKQGFGHLVNTASVAGLMGVPFMAAYSATKHAVVGLSKSMRIEGKRFGVRVSALCPGPIRTPILTGGSLGRCVYDVSDERILKWWSRIGITELGTFTKEALAAIAKNEGIIVLPKKSRAIAALLRHFPRLEERMSDQLMGITLRDFPEIKARTPV